MELFYSIIFDFFFFIKLFNTFNKTIQNDKKKKLKTSSKHSVKTVSD